MQILTAYNKSRNASCQDCRQLNYEQNYVFVNKMENKNYHTVAIILKSNIKIVEFILSSFFDNCVHLFVSRIIN